MKYLLLNYTIRDGDNEYNDTALLKTDRKIDDPKLFKNFLEKLWEGEKVTKIDAYDHYEVGSDYRIYEEEGTTEITTLEAKSLQKILHIFTVEL